MSKKAAILALALLLPQAGAAVESATFSVEDIEDCVERSGPAKSSVQSVTLRSVDEKGAAKESEAKLYWKKFDNGLSRVLIRFSAPLDLRGSALLVIELENDKRDMFMYLPEFKKVKRVTTSMMSNPMFGTDFSYEEFERLYGLTSNLTSRRLEDGRIGDKTVYVVESVPNSEADSAYTRILQYIEQERCIPLKSEFFEGGAEPRKVLSLDSTALREVKGVWIPDQVLIRDLREQTQTALVIQKIEIDVDIPERMFSESALHRRR